MQYIRSRDNTQVKHIRKLGRSRTYRHKHQECVVEGVRALKSFLDSRHTVRAVYIQENHTSPEDLPIEADRIITVSAPVMEKMSTVYTPSGILGHIQLATWIATQPQPGLALIEIADPGNLGTLIRSSIALNYTTVTLINCADPWNPKAVQASAGTVAHAYLHITDWKTLADATHLTTCALTAHHATPIEKTHIQHPLILIGNEAHGLPESICAAAEHRITLYMPGPAESYNAAIAGSIALYTMTNKGE